ncbi:2-dehydropantoate 2-reductase [Dysgonomonadaceae bacterium PH5-43]|nr:2-dehydropantoate 2-reductase [Dysgonomonadaceae bacterium PH5-43]
MSSLQYGIIGTGGIGGFYGGMLAKAGNKVKFLFRSDYQYVLNNGLKIDSTLGNFVLPKVEAYNDTQAMGVCDVVLVCLKTTNNYMLKSLLPPLLHKNTLVILIQNGLGLEEDVVADFPELNIAGGMAFICSQKLGHGYISHLDYGKLTLAAYNNKALSVLSLVTNDFNEAGVTSEILPDLESARWRKLVWNIPYNGSTVVLNTTTEALMNNPVSESLMRDLMEEVVAAANACGIKYPIENSFIDEMLELTRNMTPYSPSMKLDYDNGRELEIKYIYSKPIEKAASVGYDMKKVNILEKQLLFLRK